MDYQIEQANKMLKLGLEMFKDSLMKLFEIVSEGKDHVTKNDLIKYKELLKSVG